MHYHPFSTDNKRSQRTSVGVRGTNASVQKLKILAGRGRGLAVKAGKLIQIQNQLHQQKTSQRHRSLQGRILEGKSLEKSEFATIYATKLVF